MITKHYYYINYYMGFSNTYMLAYTDRPVKAEGWERITRKEAESMCSAERYLRKRDQSFSGYADVTIKPMDYNEDEQGNIVNNSHYYLDGYIWKERQNDR